MQNYFLAFLDLFMLFLATKAKKRSPNNLQSIIQKQPPEVVCEKRCS